MSPFRGPRVCRLARFLRPTGLRLGVLVAGMFCPADTAVQAAPVTFRFEAEVTDITNSTNGTINLPFNLNPGDHLNGILKFEPILFGQSGQAIGLQFMLASESFAADGVPLTTFDNYQPPGSGFIDYINVSCSPVSLCGAVSTSLSDVIIDQIGIGFSSENVSGFQAGESLADSAFWNRFEFFPPGEDVGFGASRRFVLELRSNANNATGTLFIQGDIGPMTAVPEPSSMLAALALFFLAMTVFRERSLSAF